MKRLEKEDHLPKYVEPTPLIQSGQEKRRLKRKNKRNHGK